MTFLGDTISSNGSPSDVFPSCENSTCLNIRTLNWWESHYLEVSIDDRKGTPSHVNPIRRNGWESQRRGIPIEGIPLDWSPNGRNPIGWKWYWRGIPFVCAAKVPTCKGFFAGWRDYQCSVGCKWGIIWQVVRIVMMMLMMMVTWSRLHSSCNDQSAFEEGRRSRTVLAPLPWLEVD